MSRQLEEILDEIERGENAFTLKLKKRTGTKIGNHVYSFIPNNTINPDNPYTIMISTTSRSRGSVTLAVVKTDGITMPPKIDTRCKALLKMIGKWTNLNVGPTPKCAFRKVLPEIIAWRDCMNLCHRIKLKKQKVTPEIMQAYTHPDQKRLLIEACCLAAI